MKRIDIDCCNKCCHFDNLYWSYNERCRKLNREITRGPDIDYETNHPIPDDCPLPESD